MPQLGETVTDGTVTRWFVAPGDRVAEDDDLFEVSTDKVDTTVPSAVAGVVTHIEVAEGDTVPVGALLARIATDIAVLLDADPGEIAPDDVDPDDIAPHDVDPAGSDPDPVGSDLSPTGRDTGAGPPSRFLSPVVRRILAEHRLDPLTIEGTGADRRITRDDVLRSVSATTPASPPSSPRRDPRDEVVPLTPIRRRIGQNLRHSLNTAAHTLVVMEVDYAAVDALRRREHDSFRQAESIGLSYLPFVARAVIAAIADFPRVNASIEGDELVVHHDVNLGIAVDLDFEGLVVPVVREVQTQTLRQLAVAFAQRASSARARTLGADDLAGGTFTLTNAGVYGTLFTGPIINQPQVAIVSTDGVKMRPVAVLLADGTYGVAVHPTGNLALSFDHRAFDGAYASAFLARVVAVLEQQAWSDELSTGPEPQEPHEPHEPPC
jgi:pyruvate dehydrogenase E2 component (dihydrolipoamide acetyltransferase)